MPRRSRTLLAVSACVALAACVPALAHASSPPRVTSIQLVVDGRPTTLSQAQLDKAVFTLTPRQLAAATIVVKFAGRQPMRGTAASYKRFLIQDRLATAANHVREILPDVESYNADNTGSRADVDGDAGTTGYAGMTIALLRAHYDSTLSAAAVGIVRSSATAYCIQSTVKGQSEFKNGPSATIEPGHCPAR